MKTQVSIIAREFTPAETAVITGVSVTLQRDWRRRGILPERQADGWSKFSLNDVIKLYVLKFFSDAHFSVKELFDVAPIAILPVHTALQRIPEKWVFEGDKVSLAFKRRIIETSVSGSSSRFLCIAHSPDLPLIGATARLNSFDAISEWFDGRGSIAGFTALDLVVVAAHIAARCEGPLFRVECEVVK